MGTIPTGVSDCTRVVRKCGDGYLEFFSSCPPLRLSPNIYYTNSRRDTNPTQPNNIRTATAFNPASSTYLEPSSLPRFSYCHRRPSSSPLRCRRRHPSSRPWTTTTSRASPASWGSRAPASASGDAGGHPPPPPGATAPQQEHSISSPPRRRRRTRSAAA